MTTILFARPFNIRLHECTATIHSVDARGGWFDEKTSQRLPNQRSAACVLLTTFWNWAPRQAALRPLLLQTNPPRKSGVRVSAGASSKSEGSHASVDHQPARMQADAREASRGDITT